MGNGLENYPFTQAVLSNHERWALVDDDCQEFLKQLPDNSIDAIVSDPPGAVSFMQCEWDSDRGGRDAWVAWLADVFRECLRVLKPGGHALVWSLPRTSHWTAWALESAGFDVRDCVYHIQGSGFPKNLSVGKAVDKKLGMKRPVIGLRHDAAKLNKSVQQAPGGWITSHRDPNLTAPASVEAATWEGWGTALKPSVETWWLVRKPLEKGLTVAENVLKWGTGALNIDGCRVNYANDKDRQTNLKRDGHDSAAQSSVELPHYRQWGAWQGGHGRHPANLILSHSDACQEGHCAADCPVAELDQQSGTSTSRAGKPRKSKTPGDGWGMTKTGTEYNDQGGASRFFYVAKPSRAEREEGLAGLPERDKNAVYGAGLNSATKIRTEEQAENGVERGGVKNHHPCLTPDSVVVTENGYKPISEVRLGERVLAADGQFHAAVDISAHDGPDHVYEIRAAGGNITVKATAEHPFLVWRPQRDGFAIIGNDVLWAPAEHVRPSDYLMTPVLRPSTQTDDVRSPDYWFVVGLWLAEGSVHGSYPAFTLHEREDHLVARIRRVFPETRTYKHGEHAQLAVVLRKGVVEDFVKLCSKGARTKRLHPDVFDLPESAQRELLEGYLAGDGCRVRGYWSIKTASPALASQIAVLSERLGYKAAVYANAPQPPCYIEGREVIGGPFFQLYLYEINVKRKRPMVAEYDGVTYTLRLVGQVERHRYEGKVWNLTVEGSHTFQTAVGMSHNTVKSITLCRYLSRLITPPNGIVLDPFAGSGSIGCAALLEGFRFVGIEQDSAYCRIATARIAYWETQASVPAASPDVDQKEAVL